MPLNLGNTLFARWYADKMAQAQANRVDGEAEGRQMLAVQEQGAKDDAAVQADAEAKAAAAGKQAQMLGQQPKAYQDTGMRVAAQLGANQSAIEQIAAARQAERAQRLERLKQMGAIDLEGIKAQQQIDVERAKADAAAAQGAQDRASRERVAGVNAKARTDAAQITANKPSMSLATKVTNDANNAGDMRKVIADIKALRPNGDFSDFLTTGNQLEQEGADKLQKWGGIGSGADPAYDRFKTLVGTISIDRVHQYFGGALTPSEAARADQAIVSMKMSPQHFKQSLDVLDELFQRVEQRKQSTQTSMHLGGSAVPQQPEARVRVRLSDGRTATLPQEQVSAFLAETPGAEVVQ